MSQPKCFQKGYIGPFIQKEAVVSLEHPAACQIMTFCMHRGSSSSYLYVKYFLNIVCYDVFLPKVSQFIDFVYQLDFRLIGLRLTPIVGVLIE